MVKGKINPVSRLAGQASVIAVIIAVLLSTVAFNTIVTPALALDHSLDGFSGTASAQSGDVNAFSGTLSMQSGTASAQSGTASAQSGSMTTESGTASAQSGSAGQESGTASAQSGTASAQSGTLSMQSGTLSVQSGTASAQSGTLSIQSGTASAQSGTLSMQSGTLSMQSGTLNVQSGVITGFSGTLSMQSGTLSMQSGETIDVSGTLSVQSGTLSMQSFTTNAESGTISIQSGTMFIYSGTLSAQSGTYTVESGTLNIQSGTLSVQSGTLSVQSGTLSAQSGTLSAQSGETFAMSGTISMQSGTLNAQSGVITGFSGTLSMQSGILTVHSGTLCAQSGTLSAQSGTLSVQSGDTLYVYSGTLSTQSGNYDVSGAISLGSGTLSVQSSLIVPNSGTLSAQSGTLCAQSGTLSVQSGSLAVNTNSGTLSVQSGTASAQSGTLSIQSGTLSAQSGTLSAQSGTASAQSGAINDFSGTLSVQSGTLSMQSGQEYDLNGATINVFSGTLSVQSGTLSAQSGTLSAQSGTLFIFSGTLSMQSGETVCIDSGTLSVQSGTISMQSGAVLVQCGTLSAQSGTISMQSGESVVVNSGTLSVQSGQVDTKAGIINMLKGTLSVQSGTVDGVPFSGAITGLSGTLSMQSGTLNAQSGTLSMQSGTLSVQSGTLCAQSGTLSAQSGTISMQSGTLCARSGTASAQSGFFAADPDSLSADASLGLQGKWFNLAFMDEPIAPTIEGLAIVNFTPNPANYNSNTGLFHAAAAEGSLRIKTDTGYNVLDMANVEVDYNDANYYYDYDTVPDMVVKGKFTLPTPLTVSQLNAADWRNQYLQDFAVDRGEFHTVLIGSGPGYGDGKNYELYGRIYLYGTYKGEDRVLVTDFMNQLDFGVEGLGDCCHPMTDGRFHMEGDWYCYPGAYLMGWRAPKIWSAGDMSVLSSGSTPVKLSYSSDYVYMPWLTRTFKVSGNGFSGEWTLPAESISNVITTKNSYVEIPRDQLPIAPGVYAGEVSAATADGYAGINGYDRFEIVVSADVGDIDVRLAEMADVHSAVMYATFPAQGTDMTCEWDWGDGTVNTIAVPAGATTSTDVHTYEQAGEYPVRVTLLKGGTVVAKKAYCEYHGMTSFPWYDTQQALYRQYLGIKGLTPITVGQYENYVITRTYFCDNESSGLYTAKVYWGDGTESACGMYGINNRLVYYADGVPRQDALSGLVRGGHVYNTPGTYEVRMVVYKDGAEFATAYTTVRVETVHEWDGNTEYNGQLGMGQQLDNVYYTVDWGDGTVQDSGPYPGGRLQVSHAYHKGGFFTVTVSFWLGNSYTDLITRWQYDMLGAVTKGVDISAGGADIVRDGVTMGTRDVSMGDSYTMSVDFPTTYRETLASGVRFAEPGVNTPKLSAIFHWGDGTSSVDVVPDANGVVHCEDTHVYAEPGRYAPGVELVVDTDSIIGIGTSDMLDIRYLAGPIDVTVAGDTVVTSAGLPGGVSGLTAEWTLVKKGDPSITYFDSGDISSTVIEITGTFAGVSPGQYILTLDLKDSSGSVIFSEVYYYVSV